MSECKIFVTHTPLGDEDESEGESEGEEDSEGEEEEEEGTAIPVTEFEVSHKKKFVNLSKIFFDDNYTGSRRERRGCY